jgi:hypothetical protein
MKTWFVRILLACAVALFAWLAYDRFFVSDQVRVRRVLFSAQRAVETGNVPKLSDALTQDYSDEWGMDKTMLLAEVRMIRQMFPNIRISISELKIKTDGDEAEAVLIAVASATDKNGRQTELTEQLRAQVGDRFRVRFVKTQDGWKMRRVESIKLVFS